MQPKRRLQQHAAILFTGIALALACLPASAEDASDAPIQAQPSQPVPATPADQSIQLDLSLSSEITKDPSIGPVISKTATQTGSTDLWERIRNGFAMAELDSKAVRNSEIFYTARPEYMKRIVERSRRYLFHIVEEVERRGMPTEIALLPIIESAYNPQAYSRSHASGIWQFIPSTGKHYGLQQNWWQDDRRDIVAATSAALDYLQNLHNMFGDWELALASYNWGEGAVGRSLTKNRNKGLPMDFRSIKMPLETQNYVPKLIAMKNIIANPAAFGVVLDPIPNQPYFEKIATTRAIDVKLAASLANISMDEFTALNPAHSRPVINVKGSRALLLPVDKVETFRTNLENHGKPLVSWQAYQVKKGETAEKICVRYGLSLARLKEVNGIAARKKITPGQTLLVPVNGKDGGTDISVMSNKPADPLAKIAKATHKKRVAQTKKSGTKKLSTKKRSVMLADARKRGR